MTVIMSTPLRGPDPCRLRPRPRLYLRAGPRALLVSHWAVDSNATVKLITSAMREIARDRNVGRAEAVRRAMLAMINGGDTSEGHPSAWAPFIVVGEGAR